MKLLPVIALCLSFPACTMIPTQHGTAQFWGDYEDVSLKDGSVTFTAKKMVHSGVARAHWHGLTTLGAEAVMAGIGGTPGAAAAVIPPLVSRPTTRQTQPVLVR